MMKGLAAEVGRSWRGRRWSEHLERGEGSPRRALGSQGNGGDGGELNSAEEKTSVVNFARKFVGIFLLWDGENVVPAALALKRTRRRGLERPCRAVTQPASSCMAAGACAWLCMLCGHVGQRRP